MSYENAPATTMLCTHCAACGRPLVDSVSVEAGMGPDCRKKYMKAETSPEHRAETNALVHALALTLSSKGQSAAAAQAAAQIARIRELGFDKLADKLTTIYISVVITVVGDALEVEAPYDVRFTELVRAIPGRRWNGEKKLNVFPCTSSARLALHAALVACFPGASALGPKGGFVVPASIQKAA